MTPVSANPSQGSDPTWAMFVWLPCILAAMALAVSIDNIWGAFTVVFALCVLLDVTPVGKAIRGRDSGKLIAQGYSKRGVAVLAAIHLAAGLGGLVLLVFGPVDPEYLGLGAGFAGFFIAQSLSTWRMRAELRETVA